MWIEVTATNIFIDASAKVKLNKYHISSFYAVGNGSRIFMNNGRDYRLLETYETIENLLKGEQNAECE